MKGAVFVLCSGVVLFFLFATTVHCADFSSITCNITITSNSSFQNFLSNDLNNGPWTGVRNVCFQEGLYTIPQTSSMIHISYAQTWYGAQFLSDPTCNGSFVPSCARITTARSLNSTFESVVTFTPSSPLSTYIFLASANFHLIGFAMSLNGGPKAPIVFNSLSTLQYNYFNLYAQGDAIILDTPGCSAISNYIESSIPGTGTGTNGIGTQYSSIIKNNFFASFSGIVTYSGSNTITGNIFSHNEALFSSSGPNYIVNNTFIYVSSGIEVEIASTPTVIDNNVFVYSNSYGISVAITAQLNITNNVFAGLFKSGAIMGSDNPYYLANNDFIDNYIDLTSSSWNTSDTYVLDNYCGENGVWEQPAGFFAGNTKITAFYAHTPSFFPYTLTPNHQDLPDGDVLQNIMWTVVGNDRPYFIIGDVLNITALYLLPSWYDKYDVPSSSYFSTAAGYINYLFHGANDNSPRSIGAFADLNYGKVNIISHTLTSNDIISYDPSIPHTLVFYLYSSTYFPSVPRSIFWSDPVTLNLTSDLVASVYIDPHIQNITISITSQYHQTILLDYFLYGNNVTKVYSLPLQNSTEGYNWKVNVNFTLPSGDTWVLENTHLNGLVLAKPPLECYNQSITVDKGVRKVNPVQTLTFQDVGCNTTEWEIVGVNQTALYSYYNNSIQLNISSNLSGTHVVHYQVSDLTGALVHNVKTRITIVNHDPVIDNSTFTWIYPRSNQNFPNWNLLSGCTDQDGDSLSVVQIQATAARVGSTFQQLDPFTLYFIPEKVVLHVAQTGEITLTSPSNSNPVTAGSPLALYWNKDLSFQFQITDGDITNQYAWGIASVNSV